MPRTLSSTSGLNIDRSLIMGWADALGDALGRGIARGLTTGLSGLRNGLAVGPKKRGRPAKDFTGFVAPDKRCTVAGCPNPARSKGLCSKHYQASRRKALAKA